MLTVKKFCEEFRLNLNDYYKACNAAKLTIGGNPKVPISGREMKAVFEYSRKVFTNFNFNKFCRHGDLLGRMILEEKIYYVLKDKATQQDGKIHTEATGRIDKQLDYKNKIAGVDKKRSSVISVPMGGQPRYKR